MIIRNSRLYAPDDESPIGGSADPAPKPDNTPTDIKPSSDISLDNLTDTHSASYDGFNPEVHVLGIDGKPKFKKDGVTYAKKRGRSAGSALPPQAAAGQKFANGMVPISLTSEVAAKQISNILFNATVNFLGPEWTPSPTDIKEIPFAFKNYFDARGIPNIPPEVALVFALGAYAVPRMKHENTQSKVGRIRDWIMSRGKK